MSYWASYHYGKPGFNPAGESWESLKQPPQWKTCTREWRSWGIHPPTPTYNSWRASLVWERTYVHAHVCVFTRREEALIPWWFWLAKPAVKGALSGRENPQAKPCTCWRMKSVCAEEVRVKGYVQGDRPFWRLNELIIVKHLAKSLAQSKHFSKSLINTEAGWLFFGMASYLRMDFRFVFHFFPLGQWTMIRSFVLQQWLNALQVFSKMTV